LKRPTPLLWPLLVGALSLAITAWLWQHERQTQDRHLRDNFDFGLRQTVTRIEQRMASYEQMLRGTRGLFEASDDVTREDFAAYVDALMGGADFTGLRNLAYAPLAAGRGSAPVLFAAPASDNAQALIGQDMLGDPVRSAAMLRARDSGTVVITDRVWSPATGAGETAPASSFQMFMPVYERHRAADTVNLRQVRLVGWIVATFRVTDLMSSLYGEGTPGVDVLVYDGVRVADDSRMYPPVLPAAPPRGAGFEAQEYIGFAGHTWTVQVRSRGEFEQHFSQDTARIIAIAGSAFSALLALLSWQLVTASERASAAARLMTRQLRDSAERYRRIVDTANEGIWTVDAEGRTSFVNPKLQALLGWTAKEMLGRPCTDFMDADGCAAITGTAVQQHEVRFHRRDGSDLWATLSTTPITDAEGHEAGMLAMVTDVTERRLADSRRAALEAQLRQSQKMEAIGTLAGGIAHDFNNILAAILGNAALLRQDLAAQPGAAERLAQIRQAGERARSLVQQIVTFSRQQPQALVVQPLQPLLDETVALLRSTLPALVELDVQVSRKPLYIGADATQFQQVLMNLCTNAWHALQGSTGRIVIGLDAVVPSSGAVSGLPPGPQAHLWVSDNGCGMDDATRQRAFEPFFTTKPVGQGTGLGLAVVHGIVASHHGAITLHSQPGEGSRFDLYFPLAEAPPETATAGREPALPPGQGEHVLYVDDDPVMVLMAQELLQRQGYRVTGLDDPRAALARLQAEPPEFDLVVTDFNMPELSGLDLARALAVCRPGLPVVITSGYVSDSLRAEVRLAGVLHVIQKEYTLEQLGRVVHAALLQASAEPARPA